MALIDKTYLKSTPLPIKDAQWNLIGDNQLDVVIDEASEFVEDYLDRHIESAYYTERVRGADRPFLILEEYPITELTSVEARDMSEQVTSYDPESFIIHADAGMIEWVNKATNVFSSQRTYVVNYTAGYYPVPGPIRKATALQAVEMLQPIFRRTNTNMTSTDMIPETTEQFVELLEKYRRKRIG